MVSAGTQLILSLGRARELTLSPPTSPPRHHVSACPSTARPPGSFFSGSSSKFEEAHELYVSAGNAFKMEKKWKESGDCFCKAAEMALKGDEKDDAANDYWTASKSYKKTHPERAPLRSPQPRTAPLPSG